MVQILNSVFFFAYNVFPSEQANWFSSGVEGQKNKSVSRCFVNQPQKESQIKWPVFFRRPKTSRVAERSEPGQADKLRSDSFMEQLSFGKVS